MTRRITTNSCRIANLIEKLLLTALFTDETAAVRSLGDHEVMVGDLPGLNIS